MLKESRIKSFLVLFLPGLLFMLSVSACGLFPEEQEVLAPPLVEPEEVTYITEDAVTGYIENSITCVGTLVPVNSENSIFRYTSGRLKKIHVASGDKVKKGDLIAELLTDNLESGIKLQKLTVEMKRNDLDNAGKTYEIELEQEQSKQRKLEDEYEMMNSVSESYSKKEIDAALEEADSHKASIEKFIVNNNSQLQMKALDLEAAEIRLSDLDKQLAESRLTASIDGIVTYISSLKEGDAVDAYTTIARVADPAEKYLEYKGKDAYEFKVGGEVELEADGNKFPGVVVMIPSTAPSEESEKYKDTVRIKPIGVPDGMEIGKTMKIRMVLESKDNALILPKNAVHSSAGNYIVYTLENGIRVEKYVKKGIESGTMVEITEGLKPGEKVIVE